MSNSREDTKVVIIGAGVAGLTLALFLTKCGVPCIALERHDRTYIESRQRAGVVEARGTQMFERWGLADKLLGGPIATTIDYRDNGVSRVFTVDETDGGASRFCTQQMLVNNLLRELINAASGDVRFSVGDIAIRNPESERPTVSYGDDVGRHEIESDFVIGCDGSRGVARASIPDGVLTRYSREYGYAWLAALVEAPLAGHPIMGVSDHGFVAQLPRGPQRSRYYLQCALDDGPEQWPDERIWNEIRLRLADDEVKNAPVLDKLFVPLRSVVYAPMQYRNLFLAGDAAHLVPPTGAKGMNLALHDVDVLAQGLRDAIVREDRSALMSYSDAVLPHIWKYQDFSAWMTDTMHDAGDVTLSGAFRKQVARARLDALFTSPTAARLHGDYQRGFV